MSVRRCVPHHEGLRYSPQQVSHTLDYTVTGNTPQTQPENRAFYPALDGLRAVAFLMVFFQHYVELPWGWTGVNIFFVLSGFLITGILYDTRNDPHRARNFYVRRTLRIFPLYYGVMIALLLLGLFAHWNIDWRWIVWPAYLGNFARFTSHYAPGSAAQHLADFQLFSAHNKVILLLGHFWSLCVEEQFYLVWPWLVFLLRDRRRLASICAASFPVILVVRILGAHTLPQWMIDRELLQRVAPFCVDSLLLGGLVALLYRGPAAARMVRSARILLYAAIAVLAVLAIATPFGHFFTTPYPYPRSAFTWDLSLVNLLAALVLIAALDPASPVHRILRVHPLRWLGRLTYGAYIFHDIAHPFFAGMGYAFSRAHYQAVSAAFALPATIFVAWLSYRFFETPFLNLKKRWTIHPTAAR